MHDSIRISTNQLDSAQVVTFAGPFAFSAAEKIRTTVIAALNGGSSVCLDLSAVSSIDLAGLQLICAAHRSAQALGKALQISQPPPETLLATARMAGFPRSVVCREGCNRDCIWIQPGAAGQGPS